MLPSLSRSQDAQVRFAFDAKDLRDSFVCTCLFTCFLSLLYLFFFFLLNAF
jgi:hypothetical protein